MACIEELSTDLLLVMKKPTILFIQGGGEGAYEEDKKLTVSLQHVLGGSYTVIYPKMPNEEDPNYESWKSAFDKELEKIEGRVVLAGHSVGGFLLLRYLSEKKIHQEIAGLCFVAIPFLGEGGWQYEGMALDPDFAANLPDAPLFFYHSTNDEVVPFEHLDLYARKLPLAKIRRIIGRGHQLNNDLSEVIEDIKDLPASIDTAQDRDSGPAS